MASSKLTTILPLAFAFVASNLQLASALANEEVLIYSGSGCDPSADYYLQVNTGTGYPSCGIEYNNALANGRFQSAGGTSYHAYIKAPTIDTGCDLTFSSKATDAPAGHGECGAITALLTSSAGGQCVPVVLSETFGVTFCCGSGDCQKLTGSTPSRVIADESAASKPSPVLKDVSNIKRSNPFTSKRDGAGDCTWSGSGNAVYAAMGVAQKVTNTVNCAGADSGCMESIQVMVESSTTQTFMVSESFETGLFDVVSTTLSLGYSFSYEQSHSVAKTVTYSASQGQSGYILWYPSLTCSDGNFGGDLNTCGNPGPGNQTVCWPNKLADGTPDGETSFVVIT